MAHKLLLFNFFILPFFFICCNSIEPPPPPPPDDTIKNTIIISIEWQELNAIALSWNESLIDTQGTFTYKLKRKDPSGNELEFITGQDTIYIDDNNGNGLTEGTNYSYKIEAIENSEVKDTSNTIVTRTLSPTSHNINWTVDTLGQQGDLGLLDIWGLDENNIWAVGGISLPQGGTTIIKWNGEMWNYHSFPDGGARAIWGFSENDIWIVGEWANRGFLGHFNGSTWTEFKSDYFYSNGDTIYSLYSVWGVSPEDVWAVGDKGTIVHWDGIEWKKVQSPVNLLLYDVWGTSANNIYAIRISLAQQSQLIHYDGNSWSEITNQLPAGERNFTSLWFDRGGTGYIVGNNVLYYNGGTFNRIEINQDKFLLRVRGRNSTDVFTVGQKGRVHHFNGIDWCTYPELFDETPGMELRGVYATETTVFAVGIINGGSIICKGEKK